jgi:hypothetical protein
MADRHAPLSAGVASICEPGFGQANAKLITQ